MSERMLLPLLDMRLLLYKKWSGVAVYYRLLGAGQHPETV